MGANQLKSKGQGEFLPMFLLDSARLRKNNLAQGSPNSDRPLICSKFWLNGSDRARSSFRHSIQKWGQRR